MNSYSLLTIFWQDIFFLLRFAFIFCVVYEVYASLWYGVLSDIVKDLGRHAFYHILSCKKCFFCPLLLLFRIIPCRFSQRWVYCCAFNKYLSSWLIPLLLLHAASCHLLLKALTWRHSRIPLVEISIDFRSIARQCHQITLIGKDWMICGVPDFQSDNKSNSLSL